jgi:LAO/AO transport system kinase
MNLAQGIISGDRHSLARAITVVENNAPEGFVLLDELHHRVGRAFRVGITGPPGVGKSSLVDEIAVRLRGQNATVGIVAVDPSSAFTGGALLGDRIRMQKIGLDEGVFIRSMASRGALGGLACTAFEVCDLFDAFGKDYVIVETVGVGQSEVDVARTVDLTLVVLSPESGDSIQAMKSGLMEVADILVVNKADRPGADRLEVELRGALEMGRRHGCDVPQVLKTTATDGQGIETLVVEVHAALKKMEADGSLLKRRRENLEAKLREALRARLEEFFWEDERFTNEFKARIVEVLDGRKSPYRLVDEMAATAFGRK